MHNKMIKLPYNQGNFDGEVFVFEKSDRKQFKEIYNSWSNLEYELRRIGGRRPLFPIELIEGIICLELNLFKVNVNNKVYYDLFDPNSNVFGDSGRINVKVALNAAYRMQLNEKELLDSDRIIFAKLFIENRNGLEYEMYGYRTKDMLEFSNYKNRASYFRNIPRINISYNDLMEIPNSIILRGFL